MKRKPEAALDAVAEIRAGSSVLVGGFGGAGVPYTLLEALAQRQVRDLTLVSNHCGDYDTGIAALIVNGQVRKMVASFPGHPNSYHFRRAYEAGLIELELVPQGTLAERIRAGGVGLGGFYVKTGIGTIVAEGKEIREIQGELFVYEQPIRADFALVRARLADAHGNLVYHAAQRNFNPIMAAAGETVIAEVDKINPTPLDPETIVTPGIFVDRIVLTNSPDHNPSMKIVPPTSTPMHDSPPSKGLSRQELARHVAKDIPDGSYVNVGIGIPTLVASSIPAGKMIMFQSENGILGVGNYATESEAIPDLINASREAVTLRPGGSFFHHADSFGMIRGGHIDLSIIGAYQVSRTGDLANWSRPGQRLGSIGGAMDLAVGARHVWVVMEHVTREGQPKIVDTCTYPLTGRGCVNRVYTNYARIDVSDTGLVLQEIAPGLTIEEVQAATGTTVTPSGTIRRMEP